MADLVQRLVDVLAQAPVEVVVLVAGLLAGAESVLGLGYVVPGEVSVVVSAGLLAEHDVAVLLWLVVTVSAAAGDSLGWLLGARVGPPLRRGRAVSRLGVEGWDRAAALLRRRGVWAVVGGRFLPVVRAMVPTVSGASRMPYRVFAPASLLGAALQSALLVGAGTFVGDAVVTAWPQVQEQFLTIAFVVGAAAVIGLGLVLPRDGVPRCRRDPGDGAGGAVPPTVLVRPEHGPGGAGPARRP